ncbi:LOW QUALITY PROTEIN: agamous-like MADS-box protein AGL80 [Typha angustifolia]|uniref:LOW QUALITY PROTEIN: agamous-like MADS-box protein AGL80 n=1 Tax=Typha angustifolia TaxID=59011 RepID=UPI003C2D266E
MKKASELATLCDVKICVIVYGPQEPHLEVWPSLPEATRVLSRFKSMPEMEQCKKMMNQEGFLRQRVGKIQEQLRKQERENQELEMTLLMYEGLAGRSLHDVGIEEATSLAWMVEMKVKVVHERIELLKAQMASAHAAAEMAM